jgi:hypothetical protein
MSVLLALPQSITMRSPPTNTHADYKGIRQRGEQSSRIHRTKSPRLLQRALGGRIARPHSASPLQLSVRNQQILWETVTGRTWEPELVEPLSQEVQSLQFIAPESLTVSPVRSAAPSSPAVSLEAIPAVVTPGFSAVEPIDSQTLLRYVH